MTITPRMHGALVVLLATCSAAAVATDDVAAQKIDVRIHHRQVVEPKTRRLVVPKNTMLEIHWHSDEAGELHLHGYDITVRLQSNTATISRFLAKATGRFAVNSHGFADEKGRSHDHGALLYLEVHPD